MPELCRFEGIAYAGNLKPILSVLNAYPLDNFILEVEFCDGVQNVVDMTSLMDSPAFLPLKDKAVFDCVYVEYGIPMWCDGEIDISPEWLYENGQKKEP